jgi:hypothetical protein
MKKKFFCILKATKEQRMNGIHIRKPGVRIRGSGSVNVMDPEHCTKQLPHWHIHAQAALSVKTKRWIAAALDLGYYILLKLSIVCTLYSKYRMYLFGVKLQSEEFAERALGALISICVLPFAGNRIGNINSTIIPFRER